MCIISWRLVKFKLLVFTLHKILLASSTCSYTFIAGFASTEALCGYSIYGQRLVFICGGYYLIISLNQRTTEISKSQTSSSDCRLDPAHYKQELIGTPCSTNHFYLYYFLTSVVSSNDKTNPSFARPSS
jgi:hypothetical protein